ncbi:uncharacterized protein [Bemisia tabaci]|uniref:uncharacterized protein isoform X2 n=1 Tax=Bemisia tabaci TaxID=7038 RepID=UPI003B282211
MVEERVKGPNNIEEMETRVIKFNYLLLTLCYMFGFYYMIQGLLFYSGKFTLLKVPIIIQGILAKAFIIIGGNCILIISVGCHAMRGHLLFLALHAISSVIILTGLVAISVYLITQLLSLSDIIYTDMRLLINSYEMDPVNRHSMDVIQKEGRCCGCRSIDDWLPKNEVPSACIDATFTKNISFSAEKKIVFRGISNDTLTDPPFIILGTMPTGFCHKNGCYSSYRQLISRNLSILLTIFILNSVLLGISIYIQSYFFVETALKEEEQCIAVAEASREEQRQIVRLRNQSSGRLFCSTPTQYDESFEIVEFTESEENIVYPKSRWEKFWQTFIGSESLFASRYMRSQRRPHRRALNSEENDGNDMVHWMYYF